MFPCVGGLGGLGSGFGCGGCFLDSCFLDVWRGSFGCLGGGFGFGMIVGTGMTASAGAFFVA